MYSAHMLFACAEEAIPIALAGRNILARAKNGTGKTAAFCIPCLERIDTTQKHIQALVLVPTRELALQTAAVLKQLGALILTHCNDFAILRARGGVNYLAEILQVNICQVWRLFPSLVELLYVMILCV